VTKDLNPGLLRRDNSEAGCRKSNMILLSAALVAITLAAPTPPGGILTLAAGETERDAILLECCDLPDKQLVLTEADLDGIVSRFNGDVPIKLQHVDSPLDPFGAVTSVRRVGKQILSRIAFPPTIAALVRDRGAGALSCGLTRAPYTLAEVSLVIKGRLAAATLLDASVGTNLDNTEQAELVRLRAETSKQRVDAQIVTLKLAGKIIPATEAAARVLLMAGAGAVVHLADGATLSAGEAFAAYLAVQPPLVTLAQLVPDATSQAGLIGDASAKPNLDSGDDITLDAGQREFYTKSLGVDPEKVLATMKADKMKAATHGATGAGHHGTSPMGSHPQTGHRV